MSSAIFPDAMVPFCSPAPIWTAFRPAVGSTAPTARSLRSKSFAREHLGTLRGFLELHIEQGPRMEAQGIELAVVTGIVGVHRQKVEVSGTQNHAGTTPFRLRHDAGRAASRAASELQDLVQQ